MNPPEPAPPALERPVEPADVEFAYALALGRPPESEAARDGWAASALPVGVLLAELLASDEFGAGVATPLAEDSRLGAGRYSAPLGRSARAWAQRLFGAAADEARTWLELLLRLHASGALRALGEAQGRDGLGQGLAAVTERRRDGRAAGDAALAAGVDGFDSDRLTGWAVDLADPDRVLRLELWVDGRFARVLVPDRFRRDLQDRYGGGGRVGFDAALPLGAADAGRRLKLELRTDTGAVLAQTAGDAGGAARLDALASITAELEAVRAVLERIERAMPDLRARTAFTLAGWDAYAGTFYAEPAVAMEEAGEALAALQVRLARGSGSPARLEAALASLSAQSHPDWTARVAADALDDPAQLAALAAAAGARVAIDPGGASAGAGGTGLVVLMSGDDRLAPGALAAFARTRAAHPSARLLYADDDRLAAGPAGAAIRSGPRLKPPFDPYLLLQENYIGSVYAADAALLAEAGDDGADHARLLRLTQAAGREGVRHIPRVLSHRADVAQEAAPDADAGAAAAQLARDGLRASAEPHGDVLGAPRRSALRLRPSGLEGVTASVIISTRDRLDLLRPCVESLERTRGANRVRFEVVVVDNGGVEPAALAYLTGLEGRGPGVQVRRDPAPFNWAAINTRAALAAAGEVLIFLNDDTLAVSPDWCDELCLWALHPRVGAAGARLLYDDGTIQHAGVVMGRGGSARHEGVGEPGADGGYLGRRQLVHATSAVTGACMATRAEVFRSMDGFDAGRFAVAFNDMDYCLRLAEAGLDIVYTPHATFTHFESKSRGFGDPGRPRRNGPRARGAGRLPGAPRRGPARRPLDEPPLRARGPRLHRARPAGACAVTASCLRRGSASAKPAGVTPRELHR